MMTFLYINIFVFLGFSIYMSLLVGYIDIILCCVRYLIQDQCWASIIQEELRLDGHHCRVTGTLLPRPRSPPAPTTAATQPPKPTSSSINIKSTFKSISRPSLLFEIQRPTMTLIFDEQFIRKVRHINQQHRITKSYKTYRSNFLDYIFHLQLENFIRLIQTILYQSFKCFEIFKSICRSNHL